ncbi:MAG: hypothetical protein ACO2PN_25580 [Pyrobaculum sp.]|jgi:hypothetical protein
MAPTESAFKIDSKHIVIVAVVLVVVVWFILSNMPPAPAKPKETPKVIKINATPPPPPSPQQPQTVINLFMCHGEAYRMRTGIMICGVEVVTDQYIFIKRGWIYAPNSTQFTLLGDVSTCRLSVSVNMLHLDCTNYIMVVRG